MNDIQNLIKSRQILFIFDARDCNPNSDRDPANQGPRIDSETGKALITDVCLKRMIRDYFLNKNNKFEKILSRNSLTFVSTGFIPPKQVFLQDVGLEEEDFNNKDPSEIYTKICMNFIDHRLFGSIFWIKGKLYATTGPVQFEISHSLNLPKVYRISISSSMASEKEKGAGALGKYFFINYGIFLTHGIIKQSLAEYSNALESDCIKLFEGLWFGTYNLLTRSKNNMNPRLLLSLKFHDQRTQIPFLKQSIQLHDKKVYSFKDCIFNIDKFVEILKIHHDKIEIIEYREDPYIKYKYNSKNLNSIEELSNIIPNCPNFQKIIL
ncbi:MAG: CRISPR-associated protein [Promethearchaeota archaeon]